MSKKLKDLIVFFKYATVGSIGTVVDAGTLYLLVEYAHLPILIGTFFSFILAVINNFILNKIWTFQNKNSNIRKQFIKFSIVAIIGLVLTLLLMGFFVYIVKIPDVSLAFLSPEFLIRGYIIAKLLTSLLVLVWNFLGNKYWTFTDKIRAVRHLEKYPFDLTVIVPAYNEEKRLPSTIQIIHTYLKNQPLSWEIIVVDDGSRDKTAGVVQEMQKSVPHLELIRYTENRGKGYAVRQGVEKSNGQYILFTDADNSTPIQEFDQAYQFLKDHEVVIGSRYIKGSDIIVQQPKLRIWIGRLGNFLIRSFLIDGIYDTQCGFKAFQHSAAQEIFSRMKIDRFGFDMELLAIARLLQYNIREFPVNWYNSADSRVRPIKDAFRTLRELIQIKLNLWGGRYH